MTEDTSSENLRKNLFPNIEIDWESPLLKGAAYDRPHSKEDYIFGFADKITDKSCRAAEALGEIGNKNAVKSLIRLLNGDITDHIYGIVSEIDDEFMDFDDYMVEKSIMSAANALGKIGDEQAIEPLINALEKALESDSDFEDDPTSCGAVVSTIADVLTDTYSIDLAKVPWTTNLAKKFALGDDYTCRDAVELLIKALEDKHWLSRKNAADALGKIGDKRAVEPLLSFWIKILEDGIGNIGRNNEFARESAVRALIKIGDGAVEPLIKALGDKEEDVRRYTARVLGNIGGKRAVEPLIKALEDKDSEVRQRAAISLGWIGDKRAVEPLIKALEDKDSEVRRYTAIALGKIGDKRAVEPLIKVLGDENEYVRRNATIALYKLGFKQPQIMEEKLGHEVE